MVEQLVVQDEQAVIFIFRKSENMAKDISEVVPLNNKSVKNVALHLYLWHHKYEIPT